MVLVLKEGRNIYVDRYLKLECPRTRFIFQLFTQIFISNGFSLLYFFPSGHFMNLSHGHLWIAPFSLGSLARSILGNLLISSWLVLSFEDHCNHPQVLFLTYLASWSLSWLDLGKFKIRFLLSRSVVNGYKHKTRKVLVEKTQHSTYKPSYCILSLGESPPSSLQLTRESAGST